MASACARAVLRLERARRTRQPGGESPRRLVRRTTSPHALLGRGVPRPERDPAVNIGIERLLAGQIAPRQFGIVVAAAWAVVGKTPCNCRIAARAGRADLHVAVLGQRRHVEIDGRLRGPHLGQGFDRFDRKLGVGAFDDVGQRIDRIAAHGGQRAADGRVLGLPAGDRPSTAINASTAAPWARCSLLKAAARTSGDGSCNCLISSAKRAGSRRRRSIAPNAAWITCSFSGRNSVRPARSVNAGVWYSSTRAAHWPSSSLASSSFRKYLLANSGRLASSSNCAV